MDRVKGGYFLPGRVLRRNVKTKIKTKVKIKIEQDINTMKIDIKRKIYSLQQKPGWVFSSPTPTARYIYLKKRVTF